MERKVLLLIDWDNLFISLYNRFKAEMRIAERLKKLIEWIQKDIGPILCEHGFVFAPEHLSFFHQQICTENKLKLVVCPKRKLDKPKRNPKTSELSSEEDTVDETLIWWGELMMRHPDVRFICLVAGDNDYAKFLEEAPKYSVKRVIVPPTIDSLSRKKDLIRLADKHPVTLRKMILMLDSFSL